MIRIIILSLVFVLIIVSYPLATTHYVKIGGSDSNAGTSWATAWATISKVNSGTSGGDTVYFGTGTWRGQLIPASGGTANDRTCYACSSFVQGIAKIYGGVQLSGWEQYSGNIYKIGWTSQSGGTALVNILAQNDSMLWRKNSLANVNGEGKYYHNTDVDTIYAWCYGGGDPDNYTMEASDRAVVQITSRNKSYTTFWGLTLKYGDRIINIEADPKPNYLHIEHCNISRGSANDASNPAGIYFSSCTDDTASFGHYNVVRACSLGHFIDHSMTVFHGAGVVVYSEMYLVVESCYVFPPFAVGIEKKGYGYNSSLCHNIVFRYNRIVGIPEPLQNPPYTALCGLMLGWNHPYEDSAYGNIISDCYDGIIAQGSLSPVGQGVTIFNNTMYNCRRAVAGALDAGYYPNIGKVYKYNLFSTDNVDNLMSLRTEDTTYWDFDSNSYYTPDTVFELSWSNRTLSQWRSYGFEVNSTFGVNPGFTDPDNGDFSRYGSAQEMNLTYDGKTWTRYGAWQPSKGGDIYPPNTVKGVDTTMVTANEIYLEYQRNDSADCSGYMVRYVQGSTAPSSYNSGTFGDSTNSRDDTTLTISGLSSNREYSFTVFAHDEVPNWTTKGSQSWVTVKTSGENHCPTSPTLNLPVNGDTILGVRPILSLNNSSDPDPLDVLIYDFEIYSDSQLTNLVVSGTNILEDENITSWQVTVDLSEDNRYWWRARSYDGICYSDWMARSSFYVKQWIAEVEDSQPVLKNPPDGATLASLHPVLEVYNITGFDSLIYYFQLDSDTQFTNPIQSEAVAQGAIITSWIVSNDLLTGSYCWRTRAFGGSEFSLWSETAKFTVTPKIHVYPNPFKPSIGDENIVFDNILIGSNIKVTTLSGELVREFVNTRESQIIWDARNEEGKDVTSGVYLYFIDFIGGSTFGKIVVIR